MFVKIYKSLLNDGVTLLFDTYTNKNVNNKNIVKLIFTSQRNIYEITHTLYWRV